MLFETQKLVTVGQIFEFQFKDSKISVKLDKFVNLLTDAPIPLALSNVESISDYWECLVKCLENLPDTKV